MSRSMMRSPIPAAQLIRRVRSLAFGRTAAHGGAAHGGGRRHDDDTRRKEAK